MEQKLKKVERKLDKYKSKELLNDLWNANDNEISQQENDLNIINISLNKFEQEISQLDTNGVNKHTEELTKTFNNRINEYKHACKFYNTSLDKIQKYFQKEKEQINKMEKSINTINSRINKLTNRISENYQWFKTKEKELESIFCLERDPKSGNFMLKDRKNLNWLQKMRFDRSVKSNSKTLVDLYLPSMNKAVLELALEKEKNNKSSYNKKQFRKIKSTAINKASKMLELQEMKGVKENNNDSTNNITLSKRLEHYRAAANKYEKAHQSSNITQVFNVMKNLLAEENLLNYTIPSVSAKEIDIILDEFFLNNFDVDANDVVQKKPEAIGSVKFDSQYISC